MTSRLLAQSFTVLNEIARTSTNDRRNSSVGRNSRVALRIKQKRKKTKEQKLEQESDRIKSYTYSSSKIPQGSANKTYI